MVPEEEIDYWCKEYPDLDRSEVIEVLTVIDIASVKETFWKDNPTLPEEAVNKVVATAALSGVSVPCMSSALSYFDGYRTANLPANLLQAQRDYFGAHTYERNDKERGEFFHTNWTGRGGDTASTTYSI